MKLGNIRLHVNEKINCENKRLIRRLKMQKGLLGIVAMILFISSITSCTPRSGKVEYKVLDEEVLAKIKYSVVLEIPKEIEEKQIEEIFFDIQKKNPGYERYFMNLYLPGMNVGSGSWASAQFEDSLEITIMGLSAAKAEEVSTQNFDNSIGVWKDSFIGVIIHLVKENNEYYLLQEFDDGSSYKQTIVRQIGSEIKFSVPDSPSGDYYIIVENHLEVWDNEGKISRYEIIKNPEMDKLK